nr:MAG TPA: hypothetical protein [Caudoviricetes sp.]
MRVAFHYLDTLLKPTSLPNQKKRISLSSWYRQSYFS